jgi:SRP54-type protein, helical bundle domain./SRP54-type protein, GTPase domain.
MAFESLASKLQETFKKLRSKGKLTEKDVKEAMKDVKIALLEADVNYKVVKDFINKVNEKAVGQEVLESLTPGQQVIKIVHNELVELMGKTNTHINFASKPPTVIMFVGLQGSGKTTTCGKLAANIKNRARGPFWLRQMYIDPLQ